MKGIIMVMAMVLVIAMTMAGTAAADVQNGWPLGAPNTMDDPSYVTVDFENGMKSYDHLSSPYEEITFETITKPWVFGCADVLNIYTGGVYVVNGYSGAWCGMESVAKAGKISFDNDVSHVSLLVSCYHPVIIEAYNESGVQIASSGYSINNVYSLNFTRLSVDRDEADISYVIVHNHGNRWIVDDLIVGGLDAEQLPYSYEGQVAANLDGTAYIKHGLGYDYDNDCYADMIRLHSDLTYWNPETEVFETGTGIGNAGLILRAYNYRNDEQVVKWSTPIQMMRHDFKVKVDIDDIRPGDVVFIDVNNNGTTGVMGMIVTPNRFGDNVVMSTEGYGVQHYSMDDVMDMGDDIKFRRLPGKIIGNHNPIHKME